MIRLIYHSAQNSAVRFERAKLSARTNIAHGPRRGKTSFRSSQADGDPSFGTVAGVYAATTDAFARPAAQP